MEFLYVRIRHINPLKSKMIVFLSVDTSNPLVNKEVVKAFMIQLYEMMMKKDIKEKKLKLK